MKRALRMVGLGLFGLLVLVVAVVLIRWGIASAQVARAEAPAPLTAGAPGSTRSLEILPLYENDAVAGGYEQGHGVSYLIRTDQATLLLDLGNNLEAAQPAPLIANMQEAGVAANEADLLVISHNHPDHVGGLQGRPESFQAEGGAPLVLVDEMLAPVAMQLGALEADVATEPRVLAPGVATMGRMGFVQPMPFTLWAPLNYEQVLAVNVAGKGIVLITGCGHPSLERIVERAELLFDEPVVGIVGGLHYAAREVEELTPHIAFLAEREPALVALSPHDSGPAHIGAFREAFPEAYHDVRVGEAIQFGDVVVASSR